MLIRIIISLFLAEANVLGSSVHSDDVLSIESQRAIVENYSAMLGASTPVALEPHAHTHDLPPVKCGTQFIADFVLNRDRIDPAVLSEYDLLLLQPRPNLPESLISPSGRFLLHYSKTGSSAVYQPGIDSDGDGHPNYVESMARIADSVYSFIINTLGYPAPPADSFYAGGGDAKYDIYIDSLRSGVFGATYLDSMYLGPQQNQGTSFVLIHNDFSEFARYKERPLDAVRVTLAHEYFHAVQFGIDWSEYDIISPDRRLYWIEMTAVWMEEQMYDAINDYYIYLPYFFADPTISLQTSGGFGPGRLFHEYGAAVFPIYLSEKHGRDIIRDIWFRARDLGLGGQTFTAVDQILNERSAGSFVLALREFWLWNYFTGPYHDTGPDTLKYSEAEQYPTIPEGSMNIYTLPFSVAFDRARQPEYNGASIVRLTEVSSRSTSKFRCDSLLIDTTTTIDTTCVDSTEIVTFGMFLDSLPQPWGLSILYQYETPLDSYFVESATIPGFTPAVIQFENPDDYRSITLIFTAGTTNHNKYRPLTTLNMGFGATADTTNVRPELVDLPASVLTPYPNPAVVDNMSGANLTFRFQVPTDSASFPTLSEPLLLVDLFDASGGFVRTREGRFAGEDRLGIHRTGLYTTDWDFRNDAGALVTSGVYIAIARLYSDASKAQLLAEDKTKVLIIR